MDIHLITLVGIDNAVLKKLKKQQITTPDQFMIKTRTLEERQELSKKTGIALYNVSVWAVQLELLRFFDMSVDEASELVEVGIYSVDDLKAADCEDVLNSISTIKGERNEQVYLKEEKLKKLQNTTPKVFIDFDTTGIADILNYSGESQPVLIGESNSYSQLSEVISELGRGIAEAQKKLDTSALEVENEILRNDALYNSGISATWYVMPEVEFTLKMDYSVTKEEHLETTGAGNRTSIVRGISIMPSNAKYNGFFKSDLTQQSSLKLRFVPVPSTNKYTSRKIVPDCIGQSVVAAKKLLEEADITSYNIYDAKGNPFLDQYTDAIITAQSVHGGNVLLAKKALNFETKFRTEKKVPKCEGKTIAEAKKLLKKEKITVYNIYDFERNQALDIYDDEAIVTRQSVAANEDLLTGKSFELNVEFKPEKFVPDCVGKNIADVKKLLKNAKITVFKILDKKGNPVLEQYTDAVVTAQSISGGASLLVGESLIFETEFATKKIVPNCIGKSIDEAKKLLKNAGISMFNIYDSSEKNVASESIQNALIKSQTLSGGTELLTGDFLDLIIEF